jgi:wobble nucleotide-excising tRNase
MKKTAATDAYNAIDAANAMDATDDDFGREWESSMDSCPFCGSVISEEGCSIACEI